MQPYIFISLALSLLSTSAAACDCSHNGDAGRWIDQNDNSPAATASNLINAGGGCFRAETQGNMCVSFTNGNDAVKECLRTEAINDQSHFDNWFLWTAISCSDGDAFAQLTIN